MNGARRFKACEQLGISVRTVERWKKNLHLSDRRKGPDTQQANKITKAERKEILKVVNSPEYRNLSPKQIVPLLADDGTYIAS